ncbi:uncharacterized protein METZ01_LOCUS336047 [marine metagenome]|uniref:Type II secretion system protein GspG C-terminal domain-containing protein n=1 Tax=marine metagenome TaxID=408172 RepID=A0A382QCD5_9ZZZZ
MILTLQAEGFYMGILRKLREGFTLVELIIVMVILGILAVVAVPKMGNIISKSEIAAENAVIAQLESAIEIFAMDQVLLSGIKSYPPNPFEQLEKAPSGYGAEPGTPANGDWWFNTTTDIISHHRSNSTHTWNYYQTGENAGTIVIIN